MIRVRENGITSVIIAIGFSIGFFAAKAMPVELLVIIFAVAVGFGASWASRRYLDI